MVDVQVKSEPTTYNPFTRDSFFRDLALTSLRPGEPDAAGARDRLARHEVEQRTNLRVVAGTGGEFAPPLWVIEQFATIARAGRVIADLVPNFELPAGVSEIHIPTITTGASAQIQPQNGAATSDTDMVTADVPNTTVATIAGDEDVTQQLFDRTPAPGLDAIVYTALSRAYNESLEQELTFGTSATGRLTGITQVTGRQTDVSGSSVSVTQATGVPQIKPLVGQAMAAIGNNRKIPADSLVLAPRRWAWIASDVSEVPVVQTWPLAGSPSVGQEPSGPIAAMSISGLPAYQSGACMSGAITASDVLLVFRSDDAYLYESVPHFAVMENPLSGSLRVRLQLRRYVAFPILRPAGFCTVTALPAPTNFGA